MVINSAVSKAPPFGFCGVSIWVLKLKIDFVLSSLLNIYKPPARFDLSRDKFFDLLNYGVYTVYPVRWGTQKGDIFGVHAPKTYSPFPFVVHVFRGLVCLKNIDTRIYNLFTFVVPDKFQIFVVVTHSNFVVPVYQGLFCFQNLETRLHNLQPS